MDGLNYPLGHFFTSELERPVPPSLAPLSATTGLHGHSHGWSLPTDLDGGETVYPNRMPRHSFNRLEKGRLRKLDHFRHLVQPVFVVKTRGKGSSPSKSTRTTTTSGHLPYYDETTGTTTTDRLLLRRRHQRQGRRPLPRFRSVASGGGIQKPGLRPGPAPNFK